MKTFNEVEVKGRFDIAAYYRVIEKSGQVSNSRTARFIYDTVSNFGEAGTDSQHAKLVAKEEIVRTDVESRQGFQLERIIVSKAGKIVLDRYYE